MIDFHCHLDLYHDPQAMAADCRSRDLHVLSVTTTPSAWHGTIALAAGASRIRTALGLHPQLAHQRKHELDLFEELLPQTRYVGEIGLDGSPESKPFWSDQVVVFERILSACQASGGKICSIHSRRAASDVLNRLERYEQAGPFVLHWFSGTKKELARAVELGCWFSIGPTMLSSRNGRELAAAMPRNRLLTETDGPFAQIAAEPALPWDVGLALTGLASLWQMTRDDVEATVEHNLALLTRDGLSPNP